MSFAWPTERRSVGVTGDAAASSEGRVFGWVRRERVVIVLSYVVRGSCLKPNGRDVKLEPHGVVN